MNNHVSVRAKSSLLILFSMLYLFFSCATNPVTGEKELNLLSESQEIQLGQDADKQIIAEYGLYDNRQLAEYIDDLGQRMAKISHRPNLQFYFRLLDSPVINAFALPGGYVYITRGILAYMNSEAELAGVIGHEIGHITARHGAKAYTRAQLAQVGFGAAYIFSETFRQFSDVAQLGVQLLFMRFSRDQERQSDKLGVQYSTEVGYNAVRMAGFFGTLDRLQDLSGQSLPGWFSTHPDPGDREERVTQLAQEAQQESSKSSFEVDRDHYLNLIDGIVFGEDPRHGFVDNGYFYHPTLDFQFPVPADWQVVNTAQAVQMVNQEQSAGMQLTLSQEASAKAAADKFVSSNNAQVTYSDATRVNGFSTEVVESVVAGQQGDLKVLSYFIEKDGRIYVFHGFSGTDNYNTYRSTFQRTMGNFDRLRNASARNVQPIRLQVATVDRTTSVQDFLARYPNDKLPEDKMAILNGMQLTDTLQSGDKVKIIKE